ncbi:MAG: thiamine diphosphokinase [Tenericutes bacterium GWC2_34_14]|nr:MAG: thiamine diphosphokinase [Tenericutes bacterium GWA2_35_7]OHE29167.1 MAG: thiamine diphosphokinase [Tenericutes bacterium GWC2_34_14]OHE34250.1 MAG: thiamine diphosphokinase [Tenericutes bacterium GWE2_34_108]OHE35602.1 MAG: thiamine diphosphokinase [Tenericutes bacterium GWF1_35_14]OHE38818.1 MAG: thiamine diphosphokinase [Tenericutes bacterium GWF2_35_184]OHE43849.1 MAG: thiamine diphosphokinase [Tenericutes bacterium RIFOXYA2_FULL_36_32]OHE46253.1 MAG: thiamine diphosphokinase [Ten
MRAIIVTHPTPKDIKKIFEFKDSDVVIAVDQAVLALYKQRIKIDLAVGDFDSLTNQGMLSQLNVIKLNPIKDVTDTHQALVEASKMNPEEIIMIGGIGGDRIEHFMIHTMFFDEFPQLKIIDDQSEISLLHEGFHEVRTEGYVTFIAYPKAKISLMGFKYTLVDYLLLTYDPLCISNEVIEEHGMVQISEGRVLQIISKKS